MLIIICTLFGVLLIVVKIDIVYYFENNLLALFSMIYCISLDQKMSLMRLIFSFIIKIDEIQHGILEREPTVNQKM